MEVLRGIKLVYFETFCPVAKFAQWCLLALSTVNQWHLIQHDVMLIMPFSMMKHEASTWIWQQREHILVSKLKKSLYGLKQASKQ